MGMSHLPCVHAAGTKAPIRALRTSFSTSTIAWLPLTFYVVKQRDQNAFYRHHIQYCTGGNSSHAYLDHAAVVFQHRLCFRVKAFETLHQCFLSVVLSRNRRDTEFPVHVHMNQTQIAVPGADTRVRQFHHQAWSLWRVRLQGGETSVAY